MATGNPQDSGHTQCWHHALGLGVSRGVLTGVLLLRLVAGFSICFEPRGQADEKLGIHLPLLEQVQTGLLSGAQEAGALLGLPHHPHSHPSFSHGLKLLPGLRLQTMFASNVFVNGVFSIINILHVSGSQ